MSTKRPQSETKPVDSPAASDQGEEDVEGHVMNLPLPVAWELAKAREREIRQDTSRHQFLAEARTRVRRKG